MTTGAVNEASKCYKHLVLYLAVAALQTAVSEERRGFRTTVMRRPINVLLQLKCLAEDNRNNSIKVWLAGDS